MNPKLTTLCLFAATFIAWKAIGDSFRLYNGNNAIWEANWDSVTQYNGNVVVTNAPGTPGAAWTFGSSAFQFRGTNFIILHAHTPFNNFAGTQSSNFVAWCVTPTNLFTVDWSSQILPRQTGLSSNRSAPPIVIVDGDALIAVHRWTDASTTNSYFVRCTSSDGFQWTDGTTPFATNLQGTWEHVAIAPMSFHKVNGTFYIFYKGLTNGTGNQKEYVGLMTSPDLTNWTRSAANPVFTTTTNWYDAGGIVWWSTFYQDGTLYAAYQGNDISGDTSTVNFARSTDMGLTWQRSQNNPIMRARAGQFNSAWTEQPNFLQNSTNRIIYYGGSDGSTYMKVGWAQWKAFDRP